MITVVISVICESLIILPDNIFAFSSSVRVLNAPICMYLEINTEAINAINEKSILLFYAVKEKLFFIVCL